jgi:beta-lactam-binding protein with PASTA domain
MKESRTVPKGTTRVLSQSPKAGKPLRIGQEITLVVGVNSSTSTSTGNPDTNIDLGDRGESRYCSKRRWC